MCNRYFRTDNGGTLRELHRGLAARGVGGVLRGLLGQGETIDAIIDRQIEKFPPDRTSFRADVWATKDVVTVAVGLRVQDGDGDGSWTVMLGADFRKEGPAGHFELAREF